MLEEQTVVVHRHAHSVSWYAMSRSVFAGAADDYAVHIPMIW